MKTAGPKAADRWRLTRSGPVPSSPVIWRIAYAGDEAVRGTHFLLSVNGKRFRQFASCCLSNQQGKRTQTCGGKCAKKRERTNAD